MRKTPDVVGIAALAGMRHVQAKELPLPTRKLIDSVGAGGTFVMWKEETPVAVVVLLPATPTAGEEAMRQLNDFIRAAFPLKGAKKQRPRRGSRR